MAEEHSNPSLLDDEPDDEEDNNDVNDAENPGGDQDGGNQEEDDEGDDNEEEDPLAHLPDYVIKRVEKLQELDKAREDVVEKYLLERAALEMKFEELMQPFYQERAKIVEGSDEGESKTNEPDEVDAADSNVKGIPQFWVCAMTHVETVGELITEEDVDCLECISDVQCIDRADGKGFTLKFSFKPNDYFTNTILTKTYEVPNLLLSDEPILKNVVGDKIEWKAGKSLTHRTIQKKQRGKGKNAGQVRNITKQELGESFFHWFTPPAMPSMEMLDEEEAERLEELFDADYDVAQAFRSHIIPRAVQYFTGQADDEEMDSMMQGAIQELETSAAGGN